MEEELKRVLLESNTEGLRGSTWGPETGDLDEGATYCALRPAI